MRRALVKLASWAIGFSLGAAVAAAVVALFVPIDREEVWARLREGYQEALAESRKAALAERARLEGELAEMQNRRASSDTEDNG